MNYTVRVASIGKGKIESIIERVEPDYLQSGIGNLHTVVTRGIIDTQDAQIRAALIDLGWTPPMPPMPPRPPRQCIVKGCTNHSDKGKFVGDFCWPCHNTITTGRIASGTTFIHSMRDRLHHIADIAA